MNIVAEGAIEPLTLSGERCTDTRVLREVTQCAMNLSLQESNKMPIAESGLLPVLTLLAGHRDPIVSSHACGALANLAENMRTHERILGACPCIGIGLGVGVSHCGPAEMFVAFCGTVVGQHSRPRPLLA